MQHFPTAIKLSTAAGDVRAAARAWPDRGVGVWLMLICALLVGMILLGGATRLTDSGLSITEWQPLRGAVPPLSGADWESAFRKYQTTAEFRLQNSGMSLDEFKGIFLWEWAHRFLGRAIGLIFALPMLVFWALGRLRGRVVACLALLILGGAQGALGWWMVQSGLSARLDVAPLRLALHLGLAFIILGLAANLALQAMGWPRRPASLGVHRLWVFGFIFLLFSQILAGAAMAGSDAGRAYTDWPKLGGAWIPPGYGHFQPFWESLLENHAIVQFHHRMLGYGVAFAGFALGLLAWRRGAQAGRVLGLFLALGVLGQMLLGILTLVHGAPLDLSLAHQGGAIALWLLAMASLRIATR